MMFVKCTCPRGLRERGRWSEDCPIAFQHEIIRETLGLPAQYHWVLNDKYEFLGIMSCNIPDEHWKRGFVQFVSVPVDYDASLAKVGVWPKEYIRIDMNVDYAYLGADSWPVLVARDTPELYGIRFFRWSTKKERATPGEGRPYPHSGSG